MKFWSLAGSTALATLCAQVPAFADVTPAQVWQSWQDLSASYGQTLTAGNVDDQGDTLTVTGLAINYDQNGVKAAGTIGEMVFADMGDGTVKVTMSDSYPLTLTLPPEAAGGDPTTISLQIDQPDLTILASGDTAETSYSFTGPSVTIALTGVEGVETEAVDITAKAELANMAGKYIFTPDGDRNALSSSYSADSLTVSFAGTDPDPSPSTDGTAAPSSGTVAFTMKDITGTTNGTILNAAAMADMAAALKAGFATDGSFNAGESTVEVDVTDARGNTKLSGKGATAALSFGMNDQRIAYSGSATGVTTTMSSPDIPFPQISLSYAETAFDFLMPVSASETPADFKLLTKLVDFTISDEVWDMFDPTKQLPRDPATLVIDTKGTATLKASLFDAAAMKAAGQTATPPGELNSLEVTELRAKFAGAELTGNGAFTFDNTDTTTYGGMPAPTGKIDLKATGANTLMDKLVAMGLMPEDQVMGMRMMLSMFANATGEDELSSTLEFKDKGFYANGQRLQ
ncbi:DUF2125 domain-containing protein [Paragemmobacter straminiformis]|uniref:DUF2125 domain-containing protein n=1 Tax=Paragemmobacter straminiformis TaxID=2045119 RepID=A0A842I7S8_9RHOB|nr:DUF2125 domain-containing protein [Gemmobacter straminiformis]MBC2836132.1 DUF2125 domain-containing protein [Gemmobacter straminiformis]